MTKFLIGVATAALWFALSYAANAERTCRQVCDNGTCVSRCVQRPDSGVVVRDRVEPRRHERGFDVDTPAGDVEIRC
jgi:hypothetical protein